MQSKGKILPPKKHCRVAHSPLCISQTWWDISLKLWSNPKWPLRGNIYVLSRLPPWEDCEHTSSLFCLASCQSLWRPSGIFQRARFPLTSANAVKPKLFVTISNPCFLTCGGKVLEILDSYTHTHIYHSGSLYAYQPHFGLYLYTSTPNT